MKVLRVLLVDDHALFRRGVASLMDSQDEFEIVGEAADGLDALGKTRELAPDLILMDINMPRCDGLAATRIIKSEFPDVKIVMLTVSDSDQSLFEAIKAGAEGYLLKNLEPAQLFALLRGVSRNEAPISPVLAARILGEFARQQAPEKSATPRTEDLSPREREVLKLVTEGLTNREIATALFITENTVKNHLRNILDKLHLKNRAQAAAFAIKNGLVKKAPPA